MIYIPDPAEHLSVMLWLSPSWNCSTYPELIEKSNFFLDLDYKIFAFKKYKSTTADEVIKNAKMPDTDRKKFRVDPILTWEHGLCTKIQPLFSISRSPFAMLSKVFHQI